MFSQITLIGNLGGEPESRYSPSGDMVVSFSLAVNKSWTKDGVKQERTTWYRVSCWRKLAEVAAQYLTKGSKVMIVGEDISARAYTAKNGELAASLDVTASTIKFLSTKGEGATAGSGGHDAPADEDGLPF